MHDTEPQGLYFHKFTKNIIFENFKEKTKKASKCLKTRFIEYREGWKMKISKYLSRSKYFKVTCMLNPPPLPFTLVKKGGGVTEFTNFLKFS